MEPGADGVVVKGGDGDDVLSSAGRHVHIYGEGGDDTPGTAPASSRHSRYASHAA